jgi:methionine-rich copper-binding protein CopC
MFINPIPSDTGLDRIWSDPTIRRNLIGIRVAESDPILRVGYFCWISSDADGFRWVPYWIRSDPWSDSWTCGQFRSQFSSNISITSNKTYAHEHIIECHMRSRQFWSQFFSNISLTSNETFAHDHIIEDHMESRQFWGVFYSKISLTLNETFPHDRQNGEIKVVD